MSALQIATTRLMLEEPGDERYVGPGWYDMENIGGPRSGGHISSTLRLTSCPMPGRHSSNSNTPSCCPPLSAPMGSLPINAR